MGFEEPVLFLIFNRPHLTEEVMSVLRRLRPKRIFIAADGVRRSKDRGGASSAAVGALGRSANPCRAPLGFICALLKIARLPLPPEITSIVILVLLCWRNSLARLGGMLENASDRFMKSLRSAHASSSETATSVVLIRGCRFIPG